MASRTLTFTIVGRRRTLHRWLLDRVVPAASLGEWHRW